MIIENLKSVLFVHATGFHGRIFDKTINFLPPQEYSCFSYDQRGHGLSPWPDDAPRDALTSWDGFGDDALVVSKHVYDRHNQRIIGVGHSQGATALILAALREPQLFDGLVLYEPVIFPESWQKFAKVFSLFSESPLALASRKRRVEFDSLDDAFFNFGSKPPMNGFHHHVLRDYVRYGTEKSGDKVRLLCDPNIEAMIYNSVHLHDTWKRLPELTMPVWIISGKVENFNISAVSKRIQEQIPNSYYERWSAYGHFGPMQVPYKFCEAIQRAAFDFFLEKNKNK